MTDYSSIGGGNVLKTAITQRLKQTFDTCLLANPTAQNCLRDRVSGQSIVLTQLKDIMNFLTYHLKSSLSCIRGCCMNQHSLAYPPFGQPFKLKGFFLLSFTIT